MLISSLALSTFATSQRPIQISEETYSELTEFIEQQPDETLILRLPTTYKNLTATEYEYVIQQLNETKKMIKSHFVTANENETLRFTEQILEENKNLIIQGNELLSPSPLKGGGVSKVQQYWWGVKVYLNNTLSRKIACGTGITSAVVGAFGSTIGSKVAYIILAVGTSEITYYNRGRGVIITYNQMLTTLVGPGSVVYSLLNMEAQ